MDKDIMFNNSPMKFTVPGKLVLPRINRNNVIGTFIPIWDPSFHSLDRCFYSTKVLVLDGHGTWTSHFSGTTNKLTRWVSRTGTMNFNHSVPGLPGVTPMIVLL